MSKRTLSETASVYVISAPDGPQKIGIAGDPARRLATLRTATPAALVLHQAIPMTRVEALAVEAHAHWLLREQMAQGEWFSITPEAAVSAVMRAIADVQAGAAKPPRWRIGVPNARSSGRPARPDAPSAAERKRLSRLSRATQAVELPATVLADLDALAARHGDPSRTAAVARLVREAAP